MAPKLSGKINGNLAEALENVLAGSRIDFGLIRVVSAERSGVIGVCREYLTGAQLSGSDKVGMDALQALCRMPRGIWTIHATCEVADFVAVNQELHIPIREMLEELRKPAPATPPIVEKKTVSKQPQSMQPEELGARAASQEAMPVPHQAQPVQQQYWEQSAGTDPQTISAAQRVMPPLGALTGGTASVPPPPPPGGMLNRVKTAIGNAMSGRYRAVQPADDNALVYDPNAINKEKNVLNRVLGSARQTLSKLRTLKSRQEEQQQQALDTPPSQQAPMPQPPQPIPPMQPYRGQVPVSQQPPQPYQPSPAPPQQGPMQPYLQRPDSPYVHPAFERYVPATPEPHVPQSQQPQSDEQYPEVDPLSVRTHRKMEPTSVKDVPVIRDDGTVSGANAIFHQQVRKKTSGRNKTSSQMSARAAQAAADEDIAPDEPERAPSFWAKLFGKK